MNKTIIPNSNVQIAGGGGTYTVHAGQAISLPGVIADQLVTLGLATYASAGSTTGTVASSTGTSSGLSQGAFLNGYSIVNGSVVFTASDGSTLAPLGLSGVALTPAQTAQISGALQAAQVLDSAGHIALPVDGALDSATIGTTTAAQVLAQLVADTSAVSSHAAQLGALATGMTAAQAAAANAASAASSATTMATSLGTSLSALGTLTASDHGAITSLGTMSDTAQNELTGLLTGTFSALSGLPTLSGSTISFPHANGTTSSLILPASTGTLAVPASAPALYSDSSGVLHPVAFVATHIVSSTGTVDLAPAVVTALGGVITGSSTNGSVTTVALANGSSLVITAPQGAAGAASTTPGPAGPAGAASTVAGPAGPAGSLAAGSLINPARESVAFGGPARLVSDIVADSFTPEEWGATADGRSIQTVLGAATRYAVMAYTNDAGAQPYAPFGKFVSTQQDDYPFWAGNPSPSNATGGNTWNLATTLTTTGAGFASPVICNEDQVYFYIPLDNGYYYTNANGNQQINDHNNLYQFFHQGMTISGGGLAAGTTIISTMPRTLRISPQPAGFTLASGSVLTVCPDMGQFTVGKQVFSPQGLVPLSNITAVSGTTITLGTATVSGTASAPASVAVAQGNAFLGTGVPINQCCYVYTPVPEANVCGQTSMDTLAFWAADQYTGANGARDMLLGHRNYQVSGPVYMTGGNLSMIGRGNNKTVIYSNNQVQGSGLASVFKFYPKPGASITIEQIGIGFYNGKYRTFWDYDGCGFVPAGPYDGTTNVNAYSLNQINTASITIRGCSFQTNYSGGFGCLEMARYEGVGYSFYDNNTCVGANVPGARALRFGRGVNIEIRHNLIYYCDIPIEQDNYYEHPIVEYTLLQNCGCCYTNRRASQFSFSSLFFAEFKGGDYFCSQTPYDIRDANNFFITDYNGPGGANNGPSILLSGCLVGRAGGYVLGGGSTKAAIQLGNSVRDGVATGCGAIRVIDFASDNTVTTLLIDAGCNSITYGNISHGNSLTAAVTDNSGGAINLGGGGSASLPADYADPAATFFFGQVPQQNVGTVQTIVACNSAGSFPFWNGSTNLYTTPLNGFYEMEAEIIFADTGTAAVTTTPAYNAAPPTGTRYLGVFLANGGTLVSVPSTTSPKSSSGRYRWIAYAPSGTTLGFAMLGDVAGLIVNGVVSFCCIEKTS